MKKILLGIFSVIVAGSLSAQIEIHLDETGPDVSGTLIDITMDGNDVYPYEPHLIVTNNTGSDQQWRVRRIKTDVPADWTDQVCWPPNCYPTSGNDYLTPHSGGNPAPIIVDGSDTTTTGLKAEIKPRITPGSVDAYAIYWYYITDIAGNEIDSVGLRFFFFVGLENVEPNLEMTVSPNPATNYINVKASGVAQADLRVVDILGNVVYSDKVFKERKVDVTGFNNGVYFVIIEAEGVKPVNKKIVVRH